jgi:hypothetical protein
LGWLGNEYALAIHESGASGWENHAYAIFRCRDEQLTIRSLNDLSSQANRKDRPGVQQLESEKYKDHTIAFIALPNWLSALFGSDFKSFGKVFYTCINGYVVFANQASALRAFIDDNATSRTLVGDALFKSVTENIPGKSNRLVYVNIARAYPLLLSFASSGLLDAMQSDAQALKELGSFVFQATAEGEKIYTHVMLHKAAATKSNLELLWSCPLYTTISKKPWLVNNPKTGAQELLVQDDNHVLYFIDQNDTVVWKDTLDEPILSDIFQVDYYHNDKYQFMFNTASAVYLIDRKGDKVKDYPHKLNPKATAGMTLLDYDRRKEYRVFIPCGSTLVAQQLNGKAIDGWKMKARLEYMDQPLQYFKLGDKDFLLLLDTAGSVHLMDRKGKDRVVFDDGLGAHITTPFIKEEGQTIEQSRLLSLDNHSRIVSLYFDGRVQSEALPKNAEAFAFGLQDLNADLSPDYVYLSANELQAVSQDGLSLFTHRFKDATHGMMQLFPMSEGRGKLGIVCPQANEVYLFSDDGYVTDGFPINGNTEMLLIPAVEGEKAILICGSADKKINCYSIE